MEDGRIRYEEGRVVFDVERVFVGGRTRNEALAELLKRRPGRSAGEVRGGEG